MTKQRKTITPVSRELEQVILKYRNEFDLKSDDNFDEAIVDLEDKLCSIVGSRPFREVMYIYQQVLMQHTMQNSISSYVAAKKLGINRTTMVEFLKREGVCLINPERRM